MRHLFVVDPPASFDIWADTTIAFMREAARRGQGVFACEVAQLHIDASGRPVADFVELRLAGPDYWNRVDAVVAAAVSGDAPAAGRAVGNPWYTAAGAGRGALSEFDVVWMRKDPPYDLDYFFATHLLSLVPPPALVTNDPSALREVTEKLYVLRFPELTPRTLVSRSQAELLAFREKLGGEMVIKPLDGCGGEGVFHLTREDRNAHAILEMATAHGTRYQIAQAYVPEVRRGDKRIVLVEGEPVGAVLRVPRATESRSNFHVGGSAAKTEISAREREICARIGPDLRARGIVFAGIDVIGDWLIEVNVTSPTGVREINALDGVRIEGQVLDAVVRRRESQRGE
ncbi:MAG: glutathione synthase [Proteobacteria bacterium]|nr:glutathione synthase [Pseudomonadota bacterium]